MLTVSCSRYLATCSADTTVKLWSLSPNYEFKLDKVLQGHQRWVWDCAFSADSAYLVTGKYLALPSCLQPRLVCLIYLSVLRSHSSVVGDGVRGNSPTIQWTPQRFNIDSCETLTALTLSFQLPYVVHYTTGLVKLCPLFLASCILQAMHLFIAASCATAESKRNFPLPRCRPDVVRKYVTRAHDEANYLLSLPRFVLGLRERICRVRS